MYGNYFVDLYVVLLIHVRPTLLIILLGILSYTQAQVATFNAQFKNLADGEEVLYAKVTNSYGEDKLTNIFGYVSITYKPNTPIVISHLVYDTLVLYPSDFVDKDSTTFYLTPKTYDLKEVTYSILGERSLFDNKFVKNDLGKSDEEKVREKLKIVDMKKELIGLDQAAQDGYVLGSPITYLYDRFSKAGKERAEYERLLARDRLRKKSSEKYDDLIITTLTNFTDEELADFKEFCSFHPSYIDQVELVELYYEILGCKHEYEEKELAAPESP